MSDRPIRVRFAPSPTGPLHIGGVRTALYNYLFAKKNNGTFLLRIEDTDQTRFVPGAEKYIMESLKWLKIMPTEGAGIGGNYGPYVQSERKEMYRPYVMQLIENGGAYYAFDTPEELELMRERAKEMGLHNWQYNTITRTSMKNSLALPADEVKRRLDNGDPYVIRIKMPRNHEVRFEDMIRGWVSVNTNNLDDKVLFKSDGMPTYHLANIVDDHTMEISHVIRGEEWLPSAPMHIMLYKAFGWEPPIFAHLPLILKPDGKGKLSKRDGDRLGFPVFPLDWINSEGERYSGYREEGYYSEAVINMLAFMGWNPGTSQEIFSLKELGETFDIARVSKSGAKFDLDKTRWFQHQYLKEHTAKELANELKSILTKEEKYTIPSEDKLESICEMMKERCIFVKDMIKEGSYFFETPTEYNLEIVRKKWKDDSKEIILAWMEELKKIEKFDASNIDEKFHTFIEEKQIKVGQVLFNYRFLVTGAGAGPSMFSISEFLGKEECLKRMENGLKAVENDK